MLKKQISTVWGLLLIGFFAGVAIGVIFYFYKIGEVDFFEMERKIIPREPEDITFKEDCEERGFYWDGDKCYQSEEEKEERLSRLKEKFYATEIVSYDISNETIKSVTFWTEATCEGEYYYEAPEGYFFSSCKEGEKGSHGGCPTCEMSKVSLLKVDSSIIKKAEELCPSPVTDLEEEKVEPRVQSIVYSNGQKKGFLIECPSHPDRFDSFLLFNNEGEKIYKEQARMLDVDVIEVDGEDIVYYKISNWGGTCTFSSTIFSIISLEDNTHYVFNSYLDGCYPDGGNYPLKHYSGVVISPVKEVSDVKERETIRRFEEIEYPGKHALMRNFILKEYLSLEEDPVAHWNKSIILIPGYSSETDTYYGSYYFAIPGFEAQEKEFALYKEEEKIGIVEPERIEDLEGFFAWDGGYVPAEKEDVKTISKPEYELIYSLKLELEEEKIDIAKFGVETIDEYEKRR